MNVGDLLAAGAVLPLDRQADTESGPAAGASGKEPATRSRKSAGKAGQAAGAERADDATDVLVARAYAHPVLDGRTVVRLVPGALGEAEDLSLEYLGFAPGFASGTPDAVAQSAEDTEGPGSADPVDSDAPAAPAATAVPVGRVLRQSLGFPAWALVNDPANSRHALAVVKEMERLTRLAATKPGHAKDGFSEIGERLDRSVPHFLPTYYEEVARIFLAAESTTYASTYFGKARDAERRHALEIDEERLREVFLEFAAAGALNGRTLREQARGLSERLSPEVAFTQFRLLCMERATAGLPPHAGLMEDLRRLAKAAGRDAAAEEAALVGELLGTSAIGRAALSFWKSARTALLTAARDSRTARVRLLRLFPAEAGNASEGRLAFDTLWLELLEKSGAFALLAEGDAAAPGAGAGAGPVPGSDAGAETEAGTDAATDAGAGAETDTATDAGTDAGAGTEVRDGVPSAAWWFGQWARFRQRGWRRRDERIAAELELVERFAPQLVRDGEPVRLTPERGHRDIAPDLLDACLAAGVPVADPHRGVSVDLSRWLADDNAGRRDLAAVAADPRYVPLLRAAVEQVADRSDGPEDLRTLAAHPVLRSAVGGWLADRADDLDRPLGLPGLDRQLSRLARFGDPGVLATSPGAVDRLAAFDVAPVLARALRAGILDELGWPALDTHVAGRIPAVKDQQWFQLDDAWPALIVISGTHVAAVGPDAVLEERTLTLPAPNPYSWLRPTVRLVDGQWLIASGHGEERRATWSGRPADTFRPAGRLDAPYRGSCPASLALAGGGRCYGSRPVLPGDTSFAERRPLACDGISHWVLHEHRWHEYDPAAAVRGRASLPAFFDTALADDGAGTRVDEAASRLLPLQPGLEATPFGSKDGLLGWWVRHDEAAGTYTACSVDGSRSPATSGRGTPLPPLRLPGGAALYPSVQGSWSETVHLHDADGIELGNVETGGRGNRYAEGTDLVPPLWYWHALRHRDEAGSAVLRAVTGEQAAALLAAVPNAKADVPAAVRRVLPGITDPRLVKGVASIVGTAAAAARRIALLGERRNRRRTEQAATADAHAHDAVLTEALRGLVETVPVGGYPFGGSDRPAFDTMATLRTLNAIAASAQPARPALPAPKDQRFGLAGHYHRRHSVDWLTLAGPGVSAAAARAAAPGTPPEQRAALLEFLRTALGPAGDGATAPGTAPATATETSTSTGNPAGGRGGGGVLADPRGRLRLLDITGKKVTDRVGEVRRSGERTLLVLAFRQDESDDRQTWKALEFAPDGRFGPWEGFSLVEDRLLGPVEAPAEAAGPARPARPAEPAGPAGSAGSAGSAALVARVAERGAVPYRQEAAERFAERTGVDVSLAALLLLGLPGLGGYGKSGLPPAEVLELAGLRPTRALTARDALRRLPTAQRTRLLAALVPADPAAVERLWQEGFDPDALADTWLSLRGKRRPVPIELVERAEREGDFGFWTETVVNPEADPALHGRTRQRLDGNRLLAPDDPRAVLDGSVLRQYSGALRWLAYRLPYGDPLRPPLRDTLAALRDRLADEDLLLDLNVSWSGEGKPVAAALREAYGLPETGGEDPDGLVRVGPAFVLAPPLRGRKYEEVWLRPAAVLPGASAEGGPDHPALVLLSGLAGIGGPYVQALRDVLGEGLAAAVAADGPAGAAQYPACSAPELTADVAERLGLSQDAAALYLMLLALPDPTDRNVTAWTGWKPARAKRTRAELAATDLVVEAKRPRAGRTLFLPGGWLDLKAPALPLESWKQALLSARQLEITAQPVPELPVPELFRRAWQRVLDGDRPAFEEFVQRRTGRGRR